MEETSSSAPLAGRTAVITGGARGIGNAIAWRLARRGAAVLVADRDAEVAKDAARALVADGHDAMASATDITEEAAVRNLASTVEARWGKLDILVNNAAILDTTPLDELTRERFLEVQNINQNGALWMTMGLVGLLRRSGFGRVVNIASIIGVRGAADCIPYSMAKGGVITMTRSLAVDLAPDGILVNCICPGFVDTRMAILPDGSGHEHETDWYRDIYIKYGRIPLRRAAQPDDIAAAALFFCGDDCRYVTGQVLIVDGGVAATF